jgi:alkylhydroperoxidase family enzyme
MPLERGPARIEPLDPPYDPEVALDLEKLMPPGVAPLGIFRTLAKHPRLLRKFRISAPAYFAKGLLDPADRELIIHRACARCGAEYEWGVHVAAFARPMGFSDEWIRATVHAAATDPVWTEREALLVALVDALHDTADVPDPLWTALEERWNEAQLVELILLVGQYHLVSFFVNAARIAREEMAERFPAA